MVPNYFKPILHRVKLIVDSIEFSGGWRISPLFAPKLCYRHQTLQEYKPGEWHLEPTYFLRRNQFIRKLGPPKIKKILEIQIYFVSVSLFRLQFQKFHN